MGGAPSPTGRARAALLCSLHSPRGDRSLKTVHCTVFLTLPLMVHHDERPASDKLAGLFFVIGKCFRPDRWAAGVPKAGRNIGGPAVQAPTSKRRSGGRNKACLCRYKADEEIVLAHYSIVTPQGSSGGAEPHPYNEPREGLQNYRRYFVTLQ